MLIGLHMIVKNESEHLAKCLSSVQSLVDEIIIVDTGSQDNTIAIAKSFGATVIEIKWDDNFSKARNVSLVQAKTKWILYMDADEIFTGDVQEIRKTLMQTDKEAFWTEIENLTGPLPYEKLSHSSIRIFRSRPYYSFQRPIHEDILPSILEHNHSIEVVGKIGTKIIHYGYLPDALRVNQKPMRNLKILEKAIEETPQPPYYLYHLGLTYDQLAQSDHAIKLMQEALNLTEQNMSFRPTIVRDLAKVMIKVGSYDSAILLVEKEIQNYPNYPDLHYYLGLCHFSMNEEDKAIRAFQNATKESPSSKYVLEMGAGTFRAWTLMGDIAVKWLAYADALQFYMNALQHCPYYDHALYGFVDILIASNISNQEIKKELIHLLTPSLANRPDAPHLKQHCLTQLANVLYTGGCYQEFLEVIDDLEDQSNNMKENIIMSYLQVGELKKASDELMALTEEVQPIRNTLIQSLVLIYLEQAKPIPKELISYIQKLPQASFYDRIQKSLDSNVTLEESENDIDFLLFVKHFLHQAIILGAEQTLNRLLTLHTVFHLFVAKMKYYEGYAKKGYDELLRLMEEGSIDVEGTFLIGEYLYDQGKWDDASLLFEKVLMEQPDDVRAHIGASLCYNQQAKALLEDSNEKTPEYPLFTANLKKVNLSIELSSKYSWHSNWRGRQRRNRNNEKQHLVMHDC
ncbi:glycosyltransferase [Bacillus sp. es.036]|uniref:glycosyltransferase n=1 Tax=Bacillus sp. es.036 TaxID=1761764 RepID=UPI000BF3B96F|nr:glycosyltransferase [Bacillus sp. es.036]PFG12723.1 tetratricopeptide repeat protein [Bacillus sp. es.036]